MWGIWIIILSVKIAMEDEDSAHESDEEEISAENTVSNK